VFSSRIRVWSLELFITSLNADLRGKDRRTVEEVPCCEVHTYPVRFSQHISNFTKKKNTSEIFHPKTVSFLASYLLNSILLFQKESQTINVDRAVLSITSFNLGVKKG
jgi:hypothetical protein